MSEAYKQPEWEWEEVVLLVVTYFRSKNKPADEIRRNQEIVSEILRRRFKAINGVEPHAVFRNLNGIILQSSRIRALDPETQCSRMQPTALQMDVFAAYCKDSGKLCGEAYDLVMKYYR